MENVLFTRSSTPSDEPIVDGQLIFDTSGTGKMYLDNGTDRLEMGGAMNVDSTLSKTSTNPIQNRAVAGVMLENLTDIDTVTASGFLTDALATKELHTEVNEINSNLTASDELKFRFASDGEGNYGYLGADDSFIPFKSGSPIALIGSYLVAGTFTVPLCYSGFELKDTNKLFIQESGTYHVQQGFFGAIDMYVNLYNADGSFVGTYTYFENREFYAEKGQYIEMYGTVPNTSSEFLLACYKV